MNQENEEEIKEIRKILSTTRKPWSSRGYAKVYNWKSSIPDTWVRFLGPRKFKKASELKINGHFLNNSREFLHTLTTLKLKTLAEDGHQLQNASKKLKLSEISKGIDLLNSNKYIANKISKLKSRSQNSTPMKRKSGL